MASDTSGHYHGPFTEAACITVRSLEMGDIPTVPENLYTNGLVLEVCDFAKNKGWQENRKIEVLYSMSQGEYVRSCEGTVRSRLTRLEKKYNECKKNKRSAKYRNFIHAISGICKESSQPTQAANAAPMISINMPPVENVVRTNEAKVSVSVKAKTCTKSTCDVEKSHKLLLYKIRKSQKHLASLTGKIQRAKLKLNSFGHYQKKNVDKRQNRANRNSKDLSLFKAECAKKDSTILSLQGEIDDLKSVQNDLLKKNSDLVDKSSAYRTKTSNAQKTKSKLKIKLTGHKDCVPKADLKKIKAEINQKNSEIHRLEAEIDALTQQTEKTIDLKDAGRYSIKSRMLVNELTALEVSQSKISPVIEAVAYRLFGTKIAQLPDRKTVQNMNDEGHYIAKKYISHLLDESEGWSLHKDGTTRKKQKILDTTVVPSSTMKPVSLGFCTVASETGQTIASKAEGHLKELATMSGKDEDEYLSSTLAKLMAYMSDRAANEKKSNRLLDSWRDSVLKEAGFVDTEIPKVHHCFCMMHVLLGFHKNVQTEVECIQKEIEKTESLGRDSLERFSSWRWQFIPGRVAYTASSIFGPVGDYKGARDVWESHCSLHGIKSCISHYEDNRFNGLFETCAQVIFHKQDFLYVLRSRNSNALLQSLKADLEDPKVIVFVQAMAVIFVQITGPYWNLMEGHDIPYTNLATVIQPLLQSLESYVEDPSELLGEGPPCLQRFKDVNIHRYNGTLVPLFPEYNDTLDDVLKASAKGMVKTMRKQLADFLPGGPYATPATEAVLKSTSFVPKHNLASEHNFGDLDSSQRKRPNCTMPHHSTVHMLKRNRDALKKWYSGLSTEEQETLWDEAKKSAKGLRTKHKDEEMEQRKKLYSEATKEKPSKNPRSDTDDSQIANLHLNEVSSRKDEEEELNKLLPGEIDLVEGQWVAIAYQDNWYPGKVKGSPERMAFSVDFMQRTSNSSHFKSPNGKDVQSVIPTYLLAVDIEPKSVGRGRSWTFDFVEHLDQLFERFKSVHF